MDEHYRIELPPMVEGQDAWAMYVGGQSAYDPTRKFRYPRLTKWLRRRVLWAHDHVETLWHWLYRLSDRLDDYEWKRCEAVKPKLWAIYDGELHTYPE